MATIETPGEEVELRIAELTGIPPPTIQWYLNQTPILGGTNQTLVLSDVQMGDAGTYSVMLSNHVDVVWETNAVVEVGGGLVLRNVARLLDGTVRFEVIGEEGQTFRVQATEVLGNAAQTEWMEVASGQIEAGLYEFVDEEAAAYQRRFYRVISP